MARVTAERARLLRLLGAVPLFSELKGKELDAIADIGYETTWTPGQPIVKRGQRGIGFLLILEGSAEVVKGGKRVATVKAGGFFGEMAVFDDKPRSADVVAAEPTRCFGIPSWSFFPMLESNPSVAVGIIGELVRRLRRLDETRKD
jgi:CRP-like cAMP-binding protein